MDFTHIRWDTFVKNISLKTSTKEVNLTDCEIRFSIKRRISDSSYIFTENLDIVDIFEWKAKIEISAEITKTRNPWEYYYDFQLTDSLSKVTTLLEWKLTVVYDITI